MPRGKPRSRRRVAAAWVIALAPMGCGGSSTLGTEPSDGAPVDARQADATDGAPADAQQPDATDAAPPDAYQMDAADGAPPDAYQTDATDAASADAKPKVTCGPGTADASTCNTVVDVASAITPTCTTGTVPEGTGGSIADGTYVLTEQTYYNVACSTVPLSATITLSGGCGEEVAHEVLIGGVTASFVLVTQGNQATFTLTCSSLVGTADAPTITYTATGSTLTFFTNNSAVGNPNPDRVEAFARQ